VKPLLLRAFMTDSRAIAAVEFALVAPIMLVMLAGEYALCDAMTIKRRLSNTAHTLGDLVARQSVLSGSDLTTLINASAQIAAPCAAANLSVIVAQLSTDASGHTTVSWSRALNGVALTTGANVTPPAGMAKANTAMIYTSVTYSYSSVVGQSLLGRSNLNSDFYINPRVAASVTLSN
jgi:Flp pilus assembly protein TadG